MAASSDVIVRLRAIGQAAFKSAMHDAATDVLGVGKAAETSARETQEAGRKATAAGRNWRNSAKSIAKFAGGATALFAAKRAITGAVHATDDLAIGTSRLMRTTGMDAEQASAWAEIMKVRGINTKQFQRGLVSLSKQMTAATEGNKAAVKVFDDLGISMDSVRAGDTQTVLFQMADGFARMENPAKKAALAQKLLARQGQDLIPLFNLGAGALNEQLNAAKKYGAVVGTDGVNNAKEFMARQREMQIALDGVKVSMGEALMPVIVSFAQLLAKVVGVMQPFLRNATLVKVAIVLLTVAFVTYKVAAIAATISTLSFNAALLLIPLAVAAIAVGVVILYRKWGWFHRAVDNTFAWVKKHWPLLLAILVGPIGLATLAIVRNFGTIRRVVASIPKAFRTAFDAAKRIVHDVVSWIVDKINTVGDAVKNVVDTVESIPGKVLGKLGKVAGKIVPGQHGLTMPAGGGTALVGEAGPELLQLPGGARVHPLARPALATDGITLGGVTTTANFYLDRRLVGTAVARDTNDRRARR